MKWEIRRQTEDKERGMNGEIVNREQCLFKVEKMLTGINYLLEELTADMAKHNLDTCKNCKSGLNSERCKDIHEYLKSIYENLRSLKAGLSFIR
jgi:hypothetical protein